MVTVMRHFPNRRSFQSRRGLSVIEVLTAIVVALIGLAGVLIMIPFAVSQAEVGMDTEKSVQLARNVTQDLEVRGIFGASMFTGTSATPTSFQSVARSTARAYCIDPIGVAARFSRARAEGVVGDSGFFPFLSPAATTLLADGAFSVVPFFPTGTDQTLLIQRVSPQDPASLALAIPRSEPMRAALASELFQWTDDLQTRQMNDAEFTSPVMNPGNRYPSRELGLPVAVYDQSVDTAGLTRDISRQKTGEMSLTVFTVPGAVSPEFDPVTAGAPVPPFLNDYPAGPPGSALDGVYNPFTDAPDLVYESRSFHVVYKRRVVPYATADATVSQYPFDRTYRVDWPGLYVDAATQTVSDPGFRVAYNGGTFKLRSAGILDASNAASTHRADIRRGDWMALTNVQFDFRRSRFIRNLNFYQVADAVLGTDSLGAHWLITLKGPDWDFLTGYTRDPMTGAINNFAAVDHTNLHQQATIDLTGTGASRNWRAQCIDGSPQRYLPSTTIAVHLPDVWTVFERTERSGD